MTAKHTKNDKMVKKNLFISHKSGQVQGSVYIKRKRERIEMGAQFKGRNRNSSIVNVLVYDDFNLNDG